MADEDKCKLHESQLREVFDRLRGSEMSDISMGKDIEHIRERVDEGLSKTLTEVKKNQERMFDLLNAEILPKVKDNAWWVGKVKWSLVVAFIVGVMKLVWTKVGAMIR